MTLIISIIDKAGLTYSRSIVLKEEVSIKKCINLLIENFKIKNLSVKII